MDETRKPDTTEAHHVPARRAYEKPSIVSEEIFETLALTCGKFDVSIATCAFSQRS